MVPGFDPCHYYLVDDVDDEVGGRDKMDEVDFGLDITAVDTTIGFEDDGKPPFYSKELKHDGFDMSKLFFILFSLLLL